MNTCSCFFTFFIIIINSLQYAQVLKNLKPREFFESEIITKENTGARYTKLLRVKFTTNPSLNSSEENLLNIENISDIKLQSYLQELKTRYGDFTISGIIPKGFFMGSTIFNKRLQKLVPIPDWSKVYELKFKDFVPIDSIIACLNVLPIIEYAEGPATIISQAVPNDAKYDEIYNWAFNVLRAEDAWDITKGDSAIVIGIHDNFGDTNVTRLHDDLIGKVDRHFNEFGDHGTCVAGVAGARTNNGIGIASLGWNLRLKFYDNAFPIFGILNAVHDGVDILNFSHVNRVNLKAYRDAVKTALAAGIICVAAAGNNEYTTPDTLFPAAYNFGELGQVIAVSGTKWNGTEEEFIEGFNYSPGNDPISDPTASFIDLSAPGMDVVTLSETCCGSYNNACGTSISSAFVSALAGLMLSVDSELTGIEIFDILINTAEKVGQYPYNERGWNRFLGYGRINAFEALKRVKFGLPVNIEDHNVTQRLSLEQNFPNPFNSSTQIKFSVAEAGRVSLVVFDILGREIETLVNEYKLPGTYEVIFSLSDINKGLSSGIYLFKLKANNYFEIKKGLLLK